MAHIVVYATNFVSGYSFYKIEIPLHTTTWTFNVTTVTVKFYSEI